jgi:branched-chain amino acid aminotransferase
MERLVFINGNFVEENNARLHISDLSVMRGYGAFDFFRVMDNVPVFMGDYIDRFFNSLQTLRLDISYSREELASVIHQLMSRNNIPDSGIRLQATGGYSQDTYELAEPNLFIAQQPLNPRSATLVEKGMRVITHEHVRELPQVKSINYLTGVWLQQQVKDANASDVLYHKHGEISEFARSNFFIVGHDNVVRTPAENVLPGITRKKTIELARIHYDVSVGTVTLDDVRHAREAFMTSTTKQLLPVVQVDDMIIGDGRPGTVTKFLDEQFTELVARSKQRYADPSASLRVT